MRKIIAALAVAACGTALVAIEPTPAAAQESSMSRQQAYPAEAYAQYRRYGGRYYDRGYDRRRGYGGAAAAGIAGLAAGALIGGAIASQQYAPPPPPYAVAPAGDDWYAYCAQKYRSFDPASGTYLSYDGRRYTCQ